jgi:hypothetical protein
LFHEDAMPSAAIDPRSLRYHDFHVQATTKEWWTLAEVYRAVINNATPVRIRDKPSAAMWWDRLFAAAGVLSVTVDPPSVPPGTPPDVRLILEGFALLYALRARQDPGQVGAPFTRAFAGPWCGLSERRTRDAIITAVHLGLLVRIGIVPSAHGRTTNLYVPSGKKQG